MSWLAALLQLFKRTPPPEPISLEADPVPVAEPIPTPPPDRRGQAIGGVAGASVIAAAVLFISGWEGERLNAYADGGGVWTICDGHTKGVYRGMRATRSQCDEWLADDIEEHSRGMRACATREFTPEAEVANLSLTFNIGVRAFCNSSALRRHNEGDDQAACDLIKLWNKDNGRVVRGLVNRRDAESNLCRSTGA